MLLVSLFTFCVTNDPGTVLKLNAGLLFPFVAFQSASFGGSGSEVFMYSPSDQTRAFSVFGTSGRK